MTERNNPRWARRWVGHALVALLAAQAAVPQAIFAAEAALSKEEEAAALSIVAKSKADNGDFALAAELYLQAWRLFSKENGYLYSAARCYHKAGRWEDAERSYAEFARVAGPDHPSRSKAVAYQEEVRRAAANEGERRLAIQRLEQERQQLADERGRQANQAADEQKRQEASRQMDEQARLRTQADLHAQQGQWRRTMGWSLAGSGLVLSGVGAWLLWSGLDMAAGLESDLAVTHPASGKISGIAREDALVVREEALQDQTVGGTLLALGLVGASAGLWFALGERTAPAATVGVRPGGLTLSLRF